jgi:hypothetical protein
MLHASSLEQKELSANQDEDEIVVNCQEGGDEVHGWLMTENSEGATK